MAKFSLVPYAIRVKEKGTNKYLSLGNISNLDLANILDGYLKQIPNSLSDSDHSSIIKTGSCSLQGRVLNGTIKGGDYGYTAELSNTETGRTSYQRQVTDAELIPYYFLMELPSTANKGIVVLQKFKQSGVKEAFFKNFRDYFNSKLGADYTLELDPIVPKELVREYLKGGRILKIRLIKQGFPRDTFDVNSDEHPEDKEVTSELVFSAKRGGSLPDKLLNIFTPDKIAQFLESENKSVGSMVEIKHFDFNTIKLQVRIGKSTRTIDVSDTDRLRFSLDISNDVQEGSDGHPSFDSIDLLAKKFLKDLSSSVLGGEIDG